LPVGPGRPQQQSSGERFGDFMKIVTSLREFGFFMKTPLAILQVFLALIFAISNTNETYFVEITDLDYSWIFMVNHFFHKQYQHGKDIIFNFGPMGFLFSSIYYYDVQNAKYVIGIIYHLILFYCAFFILRINTIFRFSVIFILILGMGFFYSANIILPAIIITYHEVMRNRKELPACAISILLSLLLAVASLVKSSSLILTLPLIGVLTLYRLSIKDYFPVVLISYSLFTTAILLLAGQGIAYWGDFYRGYLDVSLSYNADMGLPASPLYLGLWCACALSVLSSFSLKSSKTVALAVSILGCFLVAYKLSFVRHSTYSYLAFWVLAFVATAQIFSPLARFYGSVHRGLVFGTAIVALVTAVHIVSPFLPEGKAVQDTLTILQRRLSFFWDSNVRDQQRAHNHSEFIAEMTDLRQKFPFKDAVGPIDAYPFDLGLAYSSGLDLATRPAFQAYYATSRLMTERNRDFLATDRAAQSIIFSLLPIDGRFASLEDPLTVRAFRRFYNADQQTPDHLLLVRRATPLAETETCQESVTRLDTPIAVPLVLRDQAVWARVSLTPTALGRVAAFFLGGPPLGLTVATAGGGTQEFRFLRDAGDVGFLLSPALTSLEAAAAFYRGESRSQEAVSQFQVRNRTGEAVIRWFRPEIAVSLCALSWSSPPP